MRKRTYIYEDKTYAYRARRGRRVERTAVRVSVVVIALTLLAVTGAYIHHRYAEAGVHSVCVSPEAFRDCKPAVDGYMRSHPDLGLKYGESEPDIVIATGRRAGYRSVPLTAVPGLVLKAGSRSVTLREPGRYIILTRSGDAVAARLAGCLKRHFEAKPEVRLTAVGDIIPGRTVAKMMALKGVEYPFGKIAPFVRGADVVCGNLECPLSDRVKPPYKGMSFIAPSATIEGIKLLGVNVVSLSNNHSTNFGLNAFGDTLALLDANGIKHFGGGRSAEEAYGQARIEAKGTRFAFLGYNSVSGSINASGNRGGVAWVSMRPFSRDDSADAEMVRDSVSKARSEGGVVIACFHWGVEETHQATDSQRKMAHAACDAGADLVIGTPPHCVQPVEYYGGKVIAYSLGNLVFDQMQHEYTREGFILKCTFQARSLTEVELVPYRIQDWCQPVALEGASGQPLLDTILEMSGLQD